MQSVRLPSKKRKLLEDDRYCPGPIEEGSQQASHPSNIRTALSQKLQETASRATKLLDDQLSRLETFQGLSTGSRREETSWKTTSWSPYDQSALSHSTPLTLTNFIDGEALSRTDSSTQSNKLSTSPNFTAPTAQLLGASPPPEAPKLVCQPPLKDAPKQSPPNYLPPSPNRKRKGEKRRSCSPTPPFLEDDIPIIPFTPSKHRHFDYPDEMPRLPLTPRQLGLEPPQKRKTKPQSSPIKLLKRHKLNSSPRAKTSPLKGLHWNDKSPTETCNISEYAMNSLNGANIATALGTQKQQLPDSANPLRVQESRELEISADLHIVRQEKAINQDQTSTVAVNQSDNVSGNLSAPRTNFDPTATAQRWGELDALREPRRQLIQDTPSDIPKTIQDRTCLDNEILPNNNTMLEDTDHDTVVDARLQYAELVETPQSVLGAKGALASGHTDDIILDHSKIQTTLTDDGGVRRGISQTKSAISQKPLPTPLESWSPSAFNVAAGIITPGTSVDIAGVAVSGTKKLDTAERHEIERSANVVNGRKSSREACSVIKGRLSPKPSFSNKRPLRCQSPDEIAIGSVNQGVYASPVSQRKSSNSALSVHTPRGARIYSPTREVDLSSHRDTVSLKKSSRARLLDARRTEANQSPLEKMAGKVKGLKHRQDSWTLRQRRSPSSSPDPLAM